MKRAVLGMLLAVAVTGCDDAVPAVCQIGVSATGVGNPGGYAVKLTRTSTATPACDTATGTPASIGDWWVFDPYLGSGGTLVIGYSSVLGLPDPPDPQSSLYGKSPFTSVYPAADDTCTIDHMTMSDGAGHSYDVTEMIWLETAIYLGQQFKAKVTLTQGGCTAQYDAHAIWPPVLCETNEDCNPFHQPVGSGINTGFNQSCKHDDYANEISALLQVNFFGEDPPDPALGICHFNADFPALGGFTP